MISVSNITFYKFSIQVQIFGFFTSLTMHLWIKIVINPDFVSLGNQFIHRM